MDIKSIIQGLSQGDEKKKKYIIIALIILFFLSLIGGSAYFLTRTSIPTDNNSQLLLDIGLLTPRGKVATTTLKRLPFIELAADHPTVAPGQASKISWVASNATTCVNGNGDALDLSGSLSISPTVPYTFDVLCTGPNGIQSESITIAVTTAPIIELTATPPSVLSGKQSYVSWTTINADRCEDSEGKTLRLSSGFSIKPTAPYTFGMRCTGPKGTTEKSITVKITTPFASGADSGSGSSKPVFTDGSGNLYNADGTAYTGSSYGTDVGSASGTSGNTGLNSAGSDAGKSFTVTLTASPRTGIPFNGTTKVNWQVSNLGTSGRCTILTSNNTGTPYLPIGSFSGLNLSKTVTTHRMTSNETITLSCTKGSEEITKTLELIVGAEPPLPDPEITSFAVTVTGQPATKNYAALNSSLTAKWKTNSSTSKINKCELRRNGITFRSSVPVQSPDSGYTFNETSKGTNTYSLYCSRGEGTEKLETIMTSTIPPYISIIDCSFKNGFGTGSTEITALENGILATGNNYGLPGLILCIKQYPTTYLEAVGAGKKFMELFGFDTVPGGSPTAEVRAGDEQYLCPFTRYYFLNGSEVNNLDAEYRQKDKPDSIWVHLKSTLQTHAPAGAPTIWIGGNTPSFTRPSGWPASTISVASKLECLVSAVADPDSQKSVSTSAAGVTITGNKAVFATSGDVTSPAVSRFVVPNGVTNITVEAWGGGGGSGSNTFNYNYDGSHSGFTAGGGGGSGGYVKKSLPVAPGQVLYITVGAGGAGAISAYSASTKTYGSTGGITKVLYPNSSGVYSAITANGGAGGRNWDISSWDATQNGELNGLLYCAGPEPVTTTHIHACTTTEFGTESCGNDYPSMAACTAANPQNTNSFGAPAPVCKTDTTTTVQPYATYKYSAPGGSPNGNPGKNCLGNYYFGWNWATTGSAGGAPVTGDNGESAGGGGGFSTGSGAGVPGSQGKVIIRW